MECVYFVCMCVCRYIFNVGMTGYLCVCKYIYIYIYVHVWVHVHIHIFECFQHSGPFWEVTLHPFPRKVFKPTLTNHMSKARVKGRAEQSWPCWASLLGLAALLGQLCRAPCLGSRWLLHVPGGFRVHSGALEPAVGVLAVVERHAMDTEHVGLQVSLLRGTVGAVSALERPVTCVTDNSLVSFGFSPWTLHSLDKLTIRSHSPAGRGHHSVASERTRDLRSSSIKCILKILCLGFSEQCS